MAEAKPEAATASPKKGKGKLGFILFMVIFGAAFPFMMPTMLIAVVGMIPTLIALFTDMDQDKSSTSSVGFMNAAGVTPFVIDLWLKGQSIDNAFQILREPANLVVMYCAAAM